MATRPNAAGRGGPPVVIAEQRQLFQRVLRALNRGGVKYAVAGAFALQHYTGIWHFTKDLDVCLPAEAVDPALTVCRQAGLITEITDPVWLAKAWAGDYYVDFISGMSNGVLWVTPEWMRRARPAEVLGQHVHLLAPEEIVISKLFVTRRERFDGGDICHLFYRCGAAMDWDHLVRAVGEHVQLLTWHLMLFRYIYPAAAAEIVPEGLWLGLLERLRSRPAGAPGFRGSLIDPYIFAPDVTEWGQENLEELSRRRRLDQLRELYPGALAPETAA